LFLRGLRALLARGRIDISLCGEIVLLGTVRAVRLYVYTGVPFFLIYALPVITGQLEALVVAAVFLACLGIVDPTAFLPSVRATTVELECEVFALAKWALS
jgi:hypothetical protein